MAYKMDSGGQHSKDGYDPFQLISFNGHIYLTTISIFFPRYRGTRTLPTSMRRFIAQFAKVLPNNLVPGCGIYDGQAVGISDGVFPLLY